MSKISVKSLLPNPIIRREGSGSPVGFAAQQIFTGNKVVGKGREIGERDRRFNKTELKAAQNKGAKGRQNSTGVRC